jgi:hypothetical protein
MGKADLRLRVKRLDVLARGLAKEVGIWQRCDDAPLTLAERRVYLRGIQDALAGAETDRVMLGKVLERLADEERKWEERLAAQRQRPPGKPGQRGRRGKGVSRRGPSGCRPITPEPRAGRRRRAQHYIGRRFWPVPEVTRCPPPARHR